MGKRYRCKPRGYGVAHGVSRSHDQTQPPATPPNGTAPLRIRLIHRELFAELFSVFALSVVSLLTLILAGRMLQLREIFVGQGLGIFDIAELFLYLTPFFLLLLLPISCMLAVFLSFLRMSNDRELIALKTGGVSLYQMLPAPVVFCLLVMLMNFGISFYGLSWGVDNFRERVMEIIETRTQLLLQPGVFSRDFPGLTLYAEQVDNATGDMEHVFVQDTRDEANPLVIVAPRGRSITESDKAQILFSLEQGTIYKEAQGRLETLGFRSYVVRLDLKKLIGGYDFDDVKPKEMSYAQLWRLANDPTRMTDEDETFERKVMVEVHKRWVLPVACLVLGLFAIPFACAFEGLKQYLGLVLAMSFFLIYYTLLSVGLTLGETGVLPPAVALWFPNGLFAGVAAWLFRLAAQERGMHLFESISHGKARMRRAMGRLRGHSKGKGAPR